ncbi:MarR family winged helix-turn-helix transcriptional regulator [Actinomadura kijaniata]|uniref:MarR family winged helix-turn-helix transcriptional regulator n=1 Tax=Actinomadura kijaniata TaxID=46161 RepID=UPI003F1B592D
MPRSERTRRTCPPGGEHDPHLQASQRQASCRDPLRAGADRHHPRVERARVGDRPAHRRVPAGEHGQQYRQHHVQQREARVPGDDGHNLRHVAAEAGISKGTLTGVAKTLEGRGLVERAPHATDGRLVVLRLTGKGEELMRELFPRFNAEEAFVVERLSGADNARLAETLRSVIEHLEERGEERRAALHAASPPPPRRSGRRPRA